MSDLQEVARHDLSVTSLPPAPGGSLGPSPVVPHVTRPRGNTTCSRVPVGYFDQEGVSQLRGTLTQFSESIGGLETVLSSTETLSVPATGPYDFEKGLRTIMKLCVGFSPYLSVS